MSTYASATSKALTERSPNTISPVKSQTTKDEMTKSKGVAFEDSHSMPENKSQDKIQATSQTPSYHSPSDNILSPTSKKLSEIKGKRFASGKPQSLFAKMVRKEGLKSQEKLLESAGEP